MLDKIIQFSLNNRLMILLAAILLTICGIYTSRNAEVDVFPDLNAPTVVVMTEANGMAAEEVEQLVTFPIETAVNGSTGVRRVRSSSTMGFSVVWVEFDWDTDIYLARQIVSEKLSAIGESLPDNIGKPTIGPQSSILGELLIIGITSDKTSMLDLRTLADWTIRPRLLSTGGVAQVSVLGGDIKEFQVLFDPGKMKHYGVTIQEMLEAMRAMNSNVNGGVVNQYGNEFIVRGVISTDDVEKLGHAVVKSNDGSSVSLSDVAEVRIGAQEPRLGSASEKGKQAVLMTVTKQPNTSTIQLTEDIERALEDVKQNLPKDVNITTDTFRQSRFIDSSIDNVSTSLIEGALFVIIVLALFLANARTTVISLVTMPLSLLITMLVLRWFGLSINTMSLGGMAIAIGSLVDDAIVDVENVWRKLRKFQAPSHSSLPSGEGRGEAAPSLRGRAGGEALIYEASREVRMPILNSTLIIVASFLPLFFLDGMEGKMLIPLGISFITALFASTLVALTLTPVLCSYLLSPLYNKDSIEHPSRSASPVVMFLQRHYERALIFVLGRKRMMLSATAALLLLAIVMVFTLGHSFLPSFNEGSFTINVSTLPGVSLEESDRIGRQAEKLLMSVPEIKTVARKTGRAELDEHALGVNVSEIEAPFELDGRSHEEVLAEVREKLSHLVGVNIEIGQPISHRIDAMLSGTQANIAIKLFGDNLNRMYSIGNEIKQEIEDIEGIADLNVEQQIERPELKITPNREMLKRQGITLPDFNEFIAVNMAGETVAQVNENGKSFNLIVRANAQSRRTIEDVKNLIIDTKDGRKVPLMDVAEVTSSMGPNTINRENVKRKIVISANCSGRDVGSIVEDIREKIDGHIELPEGYHLEYGGQFESEQSASRVLLLMSIVSIIIIFLLLNAQFRNPRESAVILLNLPLALIGGVFALVITTGEISIPAIIGFISLFGIATRNGMLLITQYNNLRNNQGLGLRESIVRGSLDRMNPIIMTALTSALALVPLAMRGDLPGNEIQSPMAKVILGGLLTSTFLNAFIIPIVYEWLKAKAHPNRLGSLPNSLPTGEGRGEAEGGGRGRLLLLLLFICSTLSAQSIDINAVLASIEKNNVQLKAKQKSNAAAMADKQTENTLGETSVEYSPFYQRGVAGLASSELIVSQSLDFPTLYSARSKAETLQREVLDKEYLVLRRDIFVEAKKLCYDLVYARENADLIIQRYNAADSLRVICDKRMRHGDATAMEQNRVMMDLMNVRTEMEQNRGDIERLKIELERLGADPNLLSSLPTGEGRGEAAPTSISAGSLPNSLPTGEGRGEAEGGGRGLVVQLAEANVISANHDITLAKQEMLPKLTVGYRRNTEVRESLNGFLVGISMPLFSNSRKVKAARLRKEAIEQERENAIIQQDARRMQLQAEAKNLSNVIDTYDVTLMQKTLSTLMRAVKAGQMSIMEYYTESDRVFTLLQNRLSALNQRNKTVAELESL